MIIGDTAVLDYYRATDPGCKLQRFGDPISQDMYAVAMSKGFPLKVSNLYIQFLTMENL
jgi:ionotropic glutamate receptor NMDA 3A